VTEENESGDARIELISPSIQFEDVSATVRAARPSPGWTPGVSLVSLV